MSVKILADSTEGRRLAQALFYMGLPPSAHEIYRGRNVVATIDDDTDVPLCIKRFGTPGLIKGYIYGLLRRPKALRAYDNATKLISMGIPTPEPICAVAVVRGGRLRESYYVCRYLPHRQQLRRVEALPWFDDLAYALASFMNSLHDAGVLMKDFTQGNILYVRDGDGTFHFDLVDINRMAFDVHDRRHLMANFGAVLDTPEGLAVLARHYAAGHDNPADIERRAIDIYNATQRRLWRKRHFKEFCKKLFGKK